MVQWINVLWNNSFVNPTDYPLFCKKTGVLAIVGLGLMAGGRPADQQTIRQMNLL